MTDRNPQCYHLSASAIGAFKACPQRFRLMYREGIREAEDTESQRMGTNWHALHEVYMNAWTEHQDEDKAFDTAVQHLNEQYSICPDNKPLEDWEVERQKLLVSFMAYLWYWQDDPIEPLQSEVAFKLPAHSPRTGMPLPLKEQARVGKIDMVGRWRGMVGNVERKSTSKSLDPESDFWERSQKDTQVSMYALAFQDMREHGLEHYGLDGIDPEAERFGNTLYDVWRKPTMRPAKLSQKDTAEFLESGQYFDVDFEVQINYKDDGESIHSILVDGWGAEFEFGKSGKPAIREVPPMYGARLLDDIFNRPEYYFARKEIPRTAKDLRNFRVELFNILQAMKLYDKHGVWFENEQQCRATFPCPMIPICYGPGANAICNDQADVPNGLKRIFDVTVEGEPRS